MNNSCLQGFLSQLIQGLRVYCIRAGSASGCNVFVCFFWLNDYYLTSSEQYFIYIQDKNKYNKI